MLNAFSDVDPRTELQHVGVAVKAMSDTQNHVGVIYRIDDAVWFLHLAWHFDLRNEPVRADYHWGMCGLFVDDDLNGQVFAARLLNVANNKGVIPYGFYADGNAFDENGRFVSFPDPGMGLTCASFVIQLFQSFGHEICDISGWQTREDDEAWQAEIIALIRENISQERAQEVEAYVGRHRIRPEEAAAAVLNRAPPLEFDRAMSLAAEINAQIRTARP